MNRRTPPSALVAAVIVCAAAAAAPGVSAVAASTSPTLDLGPRGLVETRTVRTIEPGVTVTHITRGVADPSVRWVVEVSIPSTGTSPDPDAPARSIQDEASARAYADKLTAAGFPSTAQSVTQPATADVPAGVLGWRVRLDSTYATQASASAEVAQLTSAGFTGRAWYAGWDGTSSARGPWTVNVLTIDPQRFHGQLGSTFGPTIEAREKTSWLAGYTKAKAAVNGGFFVLDPAAGAPGDPAGAGVYNGVLESEPVGTRPVLVLGSDARHTEVTRPTWRGDAVLPSGTVELDGLNRVPGLIRNCGGDGGDLPTALPRHDTTCTDPNELVLLTPAYGASTPAGPGAEAVLDSQGRVVRTLTQRGAALGAGETSLQGIGNLAPVVAGLHRGQRVRVETSLRDGTQPLTRPGTSVVNGGPELVRHGTVHITQRQDGMVHPGEPSFAYGWVLQRNPRTFAGVDAQGRTVLVTVDGRQLDQLGLSIPEAAAVARSLGMVDAINLDGGGSTAMVVGGQVVTHPSDATGERPVGDAITVR
ncbi:phosphodiester glycosidase family protein [Nostocoides sp. HKS02]|uniref:phosphodiester glycosidase family protein n=1 Tax=Nostocoides sp. HKS02 TaxID=1813880 RepID=UPI0012B47F18|nr:phosphodiester glycosidase family protein [Tetrasphaera sp. HKS02]QGN57023.1 sporulation domain-containing protein [Tetrasphaera sp. HKS02]